VTTRSWQVSAAALATPTWACAILLAVLALAEGAARSRPVRDLLHVPSVGSPSRRFEMQLDGLERYAAARGEVDCIVLGNSTVLMGVDPEALARGYRARSGGELRCYSFGVAGMTASAAEAVAAILLERYRPELLLYVVTARDVGDNVDGPLLAGTPWVRYRRGALSSEGWLVEHSAAFRYWLLYRQWLERDRWPAAAAATGTSALGFHASAASLPLSPALWRHTVQAYEEIARQPPSQSEARAYAELLATARARAQIVVVEAPLHPRLRRATSRLGGFYEQAMLLLRRESRRQHVPFWRVPADGVIPGDGWLDFVHLNRRGAGAFSHWLGARLGAAVRSGRLRPPGAARAEA